MNIKLLFIDILATPLAIGMLSGCMDIAKHGPVDEYALIGMERFDELEVIGKVNPRRSEDINNSRWGLEWNSRGRDSSLAELDTLLEKMAESGVKWTRVATGGHEGSPLYDVSAEEGYYKWKELDKIIKGLIERKINVFITINKRDIDEYAGAVAALVNRYGKIVKHWEIMNEPQVTPDYIKTVKETSKVIKEIEPEAKVLAGSLARNQFSQIEYLVNSAGSCIDVITFHPYNEFPEALKHHWEVPVSGKEGGYASGSWLIGELREQLGKESHRLELWNGEGGYPSSEHTRSWKGRGPWGGNIQAKWILRRFIVDISLDIPVMIYFYLTESAPESSVDDQRVNAKGLFTAETRQPKQGYRALQHLTSIFDERLNSPKEVQSEFEIIDEGGFAGIGGENAKNISGNPPYKDGKSPYPIEVVALSGNEGDAVIYWLPWRMQEYVKPAKVNIFVEDVNIKDPVLVDLLAGDIYLAKTEISNNGVLLKGVPLADYPMAIVPRPLVEMREIEK